MQRSRFAIFAQLFTTNNMHAKQYEFIERMQVFAFVSPCQQPSEKRGRLRQSVTSAFGFLSC